MNAAGEGVTCPTCGEAIEPELTQMHLAGLDETRLECARQNIAAIKRLHERAPLVEEVPAWAKDW
jgi:hypothetical protein